MIYYNLADQGFKSSKRASVGVYNVSVQLGAHLAARSPATFLLNPEADLGALAAEAEKKVVSGGANGIRRVLWDQLGLYASINAKSSDWLFLPKGFSSFVRRPSCRLAVYIHDVVYAYWRKNYRGYRSPLLHTYFNLGVLASLRQADLIFVNSDFTASQLKNFADAHRLKKYAPIVRAGIGFDHLQSAPCKDNREGLLVYVSTWPHKASEALMDRLQRWQRETDFTEPVYVLGTIPENVRLEPFPNWHFLNTLPEDEYRALLGRVRCTVFNTEYEGFGMPPGESIIQGAAPVYSSIPTLNEVMQDMGFAYDNASYSSFAHALNSGITASRDQLDRWRQQFMAQHNWADVTDNIMRALG